MATRNPPRTSTNARGTRSTAKNTTARSARSESQSSSNENGERERNRERGRDTDRSAFSFGESGGALLGAAIAGAAIGMFANYGRKALMQGMESMAGDWDEILAAEHEAALTIFDKMLATDSSQTFKRKMLLTKLTHALDKHAHQEEMVVYPALREAGIRVEADQLEVEHGEVKTFLYELGKMAADSPEWLETVREFRAAISRHMHMEEEQVFPNFKSDLSEQQNNRITSQVNRDGFWMA